MKKIAVFSLVINFSFIAIAKPVHIDDILTQKEKFSVSLSMSYMNFENSDEIILPATFQTNNGDLVTIPTFMGKKNTQENYLNSLITLRYGFSRKLEFYGSLGLLAYNRTVSATDLEKTERYGEIHAATAGLIYQVKKEDETPSLLVGLSSNIFEKETIDAETYIKYFGNYRISATSFYTIDPVVFSLKLSYDLKLVKKIGNMEENLGNIFTVMPEMYFAVNPSTSINWGVKYAHRGKSKIDNRHMSSSTDVSYITGVSHELSPNTDLGISAEFSNSSLKAKNIISLTVSHTF